MRKLLTNWRVLLLLFLLIGSLLMISFNGLKWGVDFKGGTLFQIHLAEPVQNRQDIESITSTIEQRLDWTGLKDTQVTAWGSDVDGVEFVIAQIAETDPEEVENIEALLLKQGKFEVMIDGNLMFEGSDILQVQKEVAQGYNYRQVADSAYEWKLPFILTEEGARKFSHGAFHKCTLSGFNQETGSQYICSKTYFFIDRPTEAVLLVDAFRFESERPVTLERFGRTGRIEHASSHPVVIRHCSEIEPVTASGERILFIEDCFVPALKANAEQGQLIAEPPTGLRVQVAGEVPPLGCEIRMGAVVARKTEGSRCGGTGETPGLLSTHLRGQVCRGPVWHRIFPRLLAGAE